MAFSVRTVQNRVRRESNENKSKELQDLRRENQKLRRENSRLRRDLSKYYSFEPSADFEESVIIQQPINKEDICPACESRLTKLDLGVKLLTVCKTCKWRHAA